MRGSYCNSCFHNGCCEGLPYCNGSHYRPAYMACSECGKKTHVLDLDDNGRCYDCADTAEDEGGEE